MSTYHHGNLREELVRTAVALAREKGESGVVLRAVAREAGVSHNAAYRHFADREELLAEVAGTAFAGLSSAMARRVEGVTGETPQERARAALRAIGRAYVEYALAEPGLFACAFASKDLTGEMVDADPYTQLGRALDELVAVGEMDPAHRPGAETVCWAAVHGFSVLNLDGPLRDLDPAEREAELDRMLLAVERGLTR
ncbi:MAG: TetR/AcrR family transcriptional regulator [Nocardioides sp.]